MKDETRCDNGFVLDNCHILYLDTQELGRIGAERTIVC